MTDNTSQFSIYEALYTPETIYQLERFYGMNHTGSGGEAATRDLLLRAGLKPNMKVLDLCCGQGGNAMFMARHYGVDVHGVDLSHNLINLGKKRLAACEPIVQERVHFEQADATTVTLKKNYYDLVYSNWSIFTLPDKEKVYENILNCLREDGRVFITDFCKGDANLSQPGYDPIIQLFNKSDKLATVFNNINAMDLAGFKNIKAEYLTKDMVIYLENSLRQFRASEQAFVQDFDSNSYQTIEKDYTNYVNMMKEGAIHLVLFTATASK